MAAPTRPPTPLLHRMAPALALAFLLTVVCGGCVYLRLNTVKKQLADFRQHFAIRHEPEPYIDVFHPVLRAGDVETLTGLKPTSIDTNALGVRYLYYFSKHHPPGAEPTPDFDIPIELFFRENLLSGIRLPERFKRYVNEEAAVPYFQRIGKAQLNFIKREASWSAPGTLETMLKRDEVYSQFGPPLETASVTHGERLSYAFSMPVPQDNGQTNHFGFAFDLTLREKDQRVVRSDIRIGGSQLTIDLTPEQDL